MMRYRILLGGGFIAAILIALELAVRLRLFSPYVAPAPSQVFATLIHLLVSGEILGPLGHTLFLLLSGFLLATVSGIAVGLVMGHYRGAYALLEPLVELMRPIPKPALLPPLMLFLGFGAEMKITVIWLTSFFPILINTVQGVRSIDPVLLNTARTFGVNEARTLTRVVLPGAMPLILSGMKVALGLALVLAVLSEMLASTGGLGYEIIDMQRSFRIPEMYAWIIVVAAVGLLQTAIFNIMRNKLAFWSQ